MAKKKADEFIFLPEEQNGSTVFDFSADTSGRNEFDFSFDGGTANSGGDTFTFDDISAPSAPISTPTAPGGITAPSSGEPAQFIFDFSSDTGTGASSGSASGSRSGTGTAAGSAPVMPDIPAYTPPAAATPATAERPDYSSSVEAYRNSDTYRAYQSAMASISERLQGGRPTYGGQYDQKLMDAYNAIVQREPFKYSAEEDPIYDQYRQQYTGLGRQAMRDTIGQAAMLTGGYGNTYGQSVGQQQYNAYMQQLANIIPQLEERAYSRWRDTGDDMYRNYAMLEDLRDTDYAQWRDRVSDYNTDLSLQRAYMQDELDYMSYLQGLYNQEEQEQYSRQRDAIADARYDDETAYGRYRDTVSDARYDYETQYNAWRDSVADQRYDEEFEYQMQRDAIADARYDDETAYERSRDALNDQRYTDETAYERAWNENERDYERLMDQIKLNQSSAGASTGNSRSGSGSSGGGGSFDIDPFGDISIGTGVSPTARDGYGLGTGFDFGTGTNTQIGNGTGYNTDQLGAAVGGTDSMNAAAYAAANGRTTWGSGIGSKGLQVIISKIDATDTSKRLIDHELKTNAKMSLSEWVQIWEVYQRALQALDAEYWLGISQKYTTGA